MTPKWMVAATTWDTLCQLKARRPEDKFHRPRAPGGIVFMLSAIGDVTTSGVPVAVGAVAVARREEMGPYGLEIVELVTTDADPEGCRQFLIEAAWKATQALGFFRLVAMKQVAGESVDLGPGSLRSARLRLQEKSRELKPWNIPIIDV